MQPEWLINELYKIQVNEKCGILGKSKEFENQYDYDSLLKEVNDAIKRLKQPGGGYIPPLSKFRRKEISVELKALRKYIMLKMKYNKK